MLGNSIKGPGTLAAESCGILIASYFKRAFCRAIGVSLASTDELGGIEKRRSALP